MPNILQKHPDPPLRGAWFCTQLGVLTLPWIPLLGGLLLLASAIQVTIQRPGVMLRRPLNWGLALLGAGMAIASLNAVYRGDAFLGLVHFLPYFWLMAAQAELTGRPQQLQQIARLVVLPVIPMVIIGLGELWGGWSAPSLLWGLLPWPMQPYGTPPGRMSALLGYATNLALYLMLTWSLGLGLWCMAYQRLRQSPSRLTWGWLGGWTLVLLLNGVGLVLTQSRSAWGLALLSAFAVAVCFRWYAWVGSVLGFAGAVLGAAFSPVGQRPLRQLIPSFFWARLTDQNFSDRPLPTLRSSQWQFALELIHQRPWLGWGLRNFSPLYEAKTQVWMGHPHNLFLMLGAEIGVPLTLSLMGLMGWIFFQGTRYWLRENFLQTEKWRFPLHPLCFGSFLLAFANATLFHTFDVLIFDFRINALVWIIISQILGEFYLSTMGNLNLRRSEPSERA